MRFGARRLLVPALAALLGIGALLAARGSDAEPAGDGVPAVGSEASGDAGLLAIPTPDAATPSLARSGRIPSAAAGDPAGASADGAPALVGSSGDAAEDAAQAPADESMEPGFEYRRAALPTGAESGKDRAGVVTEWGRVPEEHLDVTYSLAEHLQGLRDPGPPLATGVVDQRSASAGERRLAWLCERIYLETGVSRWPEASTILAYQPTRETLRVRQTEPMLRAVEAVLDRHATVGGGAVRLRARFVADVRAAAADLRVAVPPRGRSVPVAALPGRGTAADLDLDVPWNRRVRAFRGASHVHVADYWIDDDLSVLPHYEVTDSGFGVTAERLPADGSEGTIDAEVAFSDRRPPFPSFTTTFADAGPAVTIEVPKAVETRARVVLPAVRGARALANLGGGAGAVLEVGDPGDGGPAPRRGWTRASAGGRDRDHAFGVLTVTRQRGGSPVLRFAFRGRDGDPVWLDPAPTREFSHFAGDESADGRAPSAGSGPQLGGTAASVTCRPAGAGRGWTFDVVLQVGGPSEVREFAGIDLPSAPRSVVSRQFVLLPGEEDVQTLEGDLGEGPETLVISLRATPSLER